MPLAVMAMRCFLLSRLHVGMLLFLPTSRHFLQHICGQLGLRLVAFPRQPLEHTFLLHVNALAFIIIAYQVPRGCSG